MNYSELCFAFFRLFASDIRKDLLREIDFSEICITSKANVVYEKDLDVIVETKKMKGKKCSVCWKISPEACPRHPE